MTEANSQTSSPKTEDVKNEQSETLAEGKCSNKPEAHQSRRTGLSKREIMEELSRQRFPWDE